MDGDSLGLQLAEAELAHATAQQGLSFALILNQEMGMVVNPNGEVSEVMEGGQAAVAGVRPGCQLLKAGEAPIVSLADLEQAIVAAKTAASSSTGAKGMGALLEVVLSDPRREARTADEVARLKAALTDVLATEEIATKAELGKPAEVEIKRAEELQANASSQESEMISRRANEKDDAAESARAAAREEAARVRAEEEEAAMRRRGGKRAVHATLIQKKDSWSESDSDNEKVAADEGVSEADRAALEARKAAAAAQAAQEAAAHRAAKKKKLEDKRAAAAEAKMTPMERAQRRVSQAQAALESARHGLDALLRLDQGPLGLVLNPDGRITQVREGGAAADAGLTPGSRLVSLGSHSKANISTTATCSLADLKKSVQEAKARGDMSLQVTVQDPKAVARAASHLGQCKVEIAQMEASEAVAAAAEAEEKAAEEASKAAELYAANEGERHMEHARSHPNAFARDVLQVLMEELFTKDIENDFAEEMVWLTLVNELANAAILRDHEDERSFTEGAQLALRDLTEEALEVEVAEVARTAVADDEREWASIESCTAELWLEGLEEALVEVATDTVDSEWQIRRATDLASADIVAEVLLDEVSSSVRHARELERSFLVASALAGDALLADVLKECILQEATTAVEDDRCARSACSLVAQELWAEIVGGCENCKNKRCSGHEQGELGHNQCTMMSVGSEPLMVAMEVREAHYAAEAKNVFQDILEEVLTPFVLVEAEREAALAEREIPRLVRSYNTSNTMPQGGGPLPVFHVKPREQAWIANMRAEARAQSLACLKAENVYREERAAIEATTARHKIELRSQRAVLSHWKQQQQLTGQSVIEDHNSSENKLPSPTSKNPFTSVLRQQQQQRAHLSPSFDAGGEIQLPPLSPVGISSGGSVGFDGSGLVGAPPKTIADLLTLAARGDDSWLSIVEKVPAIEPPPLPPPPPPLLPTSPPLHLYFDATSGRDGNAGHDMGFGDGRGDGSATDALRQRRMAQLHRVSALRRNTGMSSRARAHAERAAANAAQTRNQAQARADKLRNLLSATESLSTTADLAIGAAITAGVASVVEADGGPRSPLPLSQRLSSSRVDSLHYASAGRLMSPKGRIGSEQFDKRILDASGICDSQSSTFNLQEQYAIAAAALNEAEGILLCTLEASARARSEHENTVAALEDAQGTLAPLGALLKEVNRVAADFEKSGGGRKHPESTRHGSPSKNGSSLANGASIANSVESKAKSDELLATEAVSPKRPSPHRNNKKSNKCNSRTSKTRKAGLNLGTATCTGAEYPARNEILSPSAAGMAAVAALEASEREERQRHRRAEATFVVPDAIKQSPLNVHRGF